jgi:hypothetical protein
MQKFIVFLITLCLCACATPQKYEQKLIKETGKTEQALIASWGKPSQIKELSNGDKILTYTFKNNQVLPEPEFYNSIGLMDEDEMFYPFTYGGDMIPDGNFLGENITDYCQTKFYLKNNIVSSWQYKGNACVAI